MSVGLEVTRTVDHSRRRAHRIVVRGELDLTGAGMLSRQLTETCEEGAVLVLVDTSDVTFIDGAGLKCLHMASKEFERHGGRLVVDRTSPAVERLLELTGLLDCFRDGHGADGAHHYGTTGEMAVGHPESQRPVNTVR